MVGKRCSPVVLDALLSNCGSCMSQCCNSSRSDRFPAICPSRVIRRYGAGRWGAARCLSACLTRAPGAPRCAGKRAHGSSGLRSLLMSAALGHHSLEIRQVWWFAGISCHPWIMGLELAAWTETLTETDDLTARKLWVRKSIVDRRHKLRATRRDDEDQCVATPLIPRYPNLRSVDGGWRSTFFLE